MMSKNMSKIIDFENEVLEDEADIAFPD